MPTSTASVYNVAAIYPQNSCKFVAYSLALKY